MNQLVMREVSIQNQFNFLTSTKTYEYEKFTLTYSIDEKKKDKWNIWYHTVLKVFSITSPVIERSHNEPDMHNPTVTSPHGYTTS